MKRFRFFMLLSICALFISYAYSQEAHQPDWKKLHYLSEEEMLSNEKSTLFQETNPPSGVVRFPAEFEPMQAVTIRYPLGIPTNLVKLLSQRTKVYVIVTSSQQNNARNAFQNAGCDMSNITYYNMTTDSYWVRDYAPWYIFNDKTPAIVDNVYNRPRQNDNMVPYYMSQQLGLTYYGMNLTHTGGNMMEDGRGVGISDNLVLEENNNNETNVRNKMRSYLGIDPYHITIDPQGDYIAHVDCWGKLLAPDKILIAQLPASNSHYADYEEVAAFFANTNCCWGYPYKVYRVFEPGGNTLAPYTNSLILNNTVFVPMGSNSTYNENALEVYRTAMPGYEVIGITGNSGSTAWQNTDALHCRTRGVMDFNMLYVDHRDVVFGEQPKLDSIAITSKFIAYSGQALKQDELLVYYSIDGGDYQTAHMTATGNPDEYVGYIKGYRYNSSVDYYVYGADMSGHSYSQPSYGALEPHHFTIEDGVESTFSFNEGWSWWAPPVDADNLLEQLKQGLGANGVEISSKEDGRLTYSTTIQDWAGTLESIQVGQMYKIKTNSACSVTLEGQPIDPAEHPITIKPGYNWIGFTIDHPLSVTQAMADFNPANGDVIKPKSGLHATYSSTIGAWIGGDDVILQPGQGYIYQSKATGETKTLFFSNGTE